MYREEVFKALRDMNATDAIVRFSGGDDEGGTDSITLYDKDHRVGDLDVNTSTLEWSMQDRRYKVSNLEWSEQDKRYKAKDMSEERKAEVELVEALSEPVYRKYHGFAGEFYVDGELHWKVETETVTMIGQERVTTPEYFEELT